MTELESLSGDKATRLALMAAFDPGRLEEAPETRKLIERNSIPVQLGHGRRARMLTENARVEALTLALRRGGPDSLAEVRGKFQAHFESSPLQRMLDAYVLGSDTPLEERDEEELAASLHAERWCTEAFGGAEIFNPRELPKRQEIEGRIRTLGIRRPIDRLLAGGFIGRREELSRLHAFRRDAIGLEQDSIGLDASPAFIVYGVGGMGKSTLIARFVSDIMAESDEGDLAWAYLDFDRATLEPRHSAHEGDLVGATRARLVLEEVVRQLGAQIPGYRPILDGLSDFIEKSAVSHGLESISSDVFVRQASMLSDSLADMPLIVVLDTFEEVERRGPEEAAEVRDLFTRLSQALPRLRLIVSGRAPAEAFRSDPSHELRIGELTPDDSKELLRTLVERLTPPGASPIVVGDDTADRVTDAVGRSPLTLHLAARVITAEGVAGISDAARQARTLRRIRTEYVRGFLYHRIIDHLTTDDDEIRDALRDVARAGLALRKITAKAIEHILLPALHRDADANVASHLFHALKAEVSLTTPIDEETLGVRPELRRPALTALKMDDAVLVRRVHLRAADHYGSSGDVAERIYHQLATGTPPEGLGQPLTGELLFSISPSLDELPRETSVLLRGLLDNTVDLGDLHKQRRAIEEERLAQTSAEAKLGRGDLTGAQQALDSCASRARGTELYRVESQLREAEGDLTGAIDLAHRELAEAKYSEQPVRIAAATVRLAKLLEWNNESADALGHLEEAEEAELLAGDWGLRLELKLCRMAAAERMEVSSEDLRWEWGLDARQRLSRVGDHVRKRGAIRRLLAATLGRDEPDYIEHAVLHIGLDPDAPDDRIAELAAALRDWDGQLADGDGPGPVAKATHLPDVTTERASWRSHVGGIGDGAADIFGADFWKLRPPDRVLEALRQIFLRWKYHLPAQLRSPDTPATRAHGAPHFLDDRPLDFQRSELRRLESLLRKTYVKTGELERLATRSKVDRSLIDFQTSSRLTLRQLLIAAANEDRLKPLVRVALDDAPADRVREQLRQIIGPDWLESQQREGEA